MLMDSIALLPSFKPLPFIIVATWAFPDAIPMFFPFMPIALIDFTIVPLKFTLSFPLIIQELSSVNTIIINLDPFDFRIFIKKSFKDKIFSDQKANSLLNLIVLSKIDSVPIWNYFKAIFLDYGFEVESGMRWFVSIDKLLVLILGRNVKLSRSTHPKIDLSVRCRRHQPFAELSHGPGVFVVHCERSIRRWLCFHSTMLGAFCCIFFSSIFEAFLNFSGDVFLDSWVSLASFFFICVNSDEAISDGLLFVFKEVHKRTADADRPWYFFLY